MKLDMAGHYVTLWIGRNSKSITLIWLRKEWREVGNKPRLSTHYNGAIKGRDSCYDRTWVIGYLIVSYTNWNYSK